MAKIACDITYGTEENDNGFEVACTYAECKKCGNVTMSFGDHERSVTRCLTIMNEECPELEDNFYYDENDDLP